MGHVPPPHERPWRHPSELPPPPREPVANRSRNVAMLAGALGLVLVAVAAIAITPTESDEAVAPTSTFSRSLRAGIASTPVTTAGTALVRVAPNPSVPRSDESWGAVVAGGTTIVWGASEPGATVSYVIADEPPGSDESVTLVRPGSAEEDLEITVAELGRGELAPGLVVLDADGELVGVIDDAGEAQMLVVDVDVDDDVDGS